LRDLFATHGQKKATGKKSLTKIKLRADNEAGAAFARLTGRTGARQNLMQNENHGRIIDMATAFQSAQRVQNAMSTTERQAGKTLIMEPRTIRHQERVEDLFYLLFRRTGA
jgi:hypothetical protein